MRYFFKIVVGFLCALIAAVTIHGLALGKPVDLYTFAYRAPMAIASPVYVLNSMALGEEFYQSIRNDTMKRAGRSIVASTPIDVMETSHYAGASKGVIFSAVLTAAFWLPVIFLFRRPRASSVSHGQVSE